LRPWVCVAGFTGVISAEGLRGREGVAGRLMVGCWVGCGVKREAAVEAGVLGCTGFTAAVTGLRSEAEPVMGVLLLAGGGVERAAGLVAGVGTGLGVTVAGFLALPGLWGCTGRTARLRLIAIMFYLQNGFKISKFLGSLFCRGRGPSRGGHPRGEGVCGAVPGAG
jgi:hypothetical protein